MKNTFHDLYLLTPHKDCGICGNPDCQTFTRKICLGEQKVGDCILLKKENIQKIKNLLNKGISISLEPRYVNENEKRIIYVKPCADQKGTVMADVYLAKKIGSGQNLKYGFYDPYVMCYILENSQVFENVKCSPQLGVAKIEDDGKVILVNQKGKLTVRKAKSKEDLEATVKKVERALSSAIICGCGTAKANCAAGACNKYQKSKINELKTEKTFLDGFNATKKALRKLIDSDLDIKREIKDALYNGVVLSIETENNDSLGVFLMGNCINIQRIRDALYELKNVKLNATEQKSLNRAKKLLESSYNSYKDMLRNDEIQKEHDILLKELIKDYKKTQSNVLVEITKLANNTFFIERSIG